MSFRRPGESFSSKTVYHGGMFPKMIPRSGNTSSQKEISMEGNHGRDPSLPPGQAEDPVEGEPMKPHEWFGLLRYFLGGLGVALFFFFMMASGPKGVLAGGASLLVGLLVWVVYRFVFREVD